MDGHPTEQINIRIPATLGDRLRQVADAESNHISAVVRRLLAKGLDDLDVATTPARRPRGGRNGD